jgi:UDP-glucose-4-epimerase GalE
MRVLVTGAAGYIGSHVARALQEGGHEVVRLDRLSTGRKDLAGGEPLVRASILDAGRVREALQGCDAVAHLAGSALVSESVAKPIDYWRNNLVGGLVLAEEMVAAGVKSLVFASTCAVYGIPHQVPIDEDAPKAPISPYGQSKLAFERLLADVRTAHGLRSVSLRFFNAAGAHERGDIGELHDPETHIIPLVLRAIAGRSEGFTLCGNDFPTEDGTCVRDYVDVRDLARAHVLALQALHEGREDLPPAMNLGQGVGFSNMAVIRTCEEVTGRKAPLAIGPRRAGDPPALVARADRAREALRWTPKHDLRAMVETAWKFMTGPHG